MGAGRENSPAATLTKIDYSQENTMKISPLLLIPLALLSLTGCAEEDDGYYQVCVNETTQTRMDPSACDGGTEAVWYFIPVWYDIPAIGRVASGGTRKKPVSAAVKMNAPAKGRSAAPVVKQQNKAPSSVNRQQNKAPAPRPAAPRPAPAPVRPAIRMK